MGQPTDFELEMELAEARDHAKLRWTFSNREKNEAIRRLMPCYIKARATGDSAASQGLEKAFHHITGMNDISMAAFSSAISVLDPIGSAVSYFTGRKTMGGVGIYNRNMDGRPLFTYKSGYTRAGKVLGYVAGGISWLAFPLTSFAIFGAMTLTDVIIQYSSENKRIGPK